MSANLDSLLTPDRRQQCIDHDAADAAHDALRKAQAAHPSLRAAGGGCRKDAGPPIDYDEVAELQAQITEAKAALSMAEDALIGIGCAVNVLAARSLMTEAIGYLQED